MSGVVIGQPPEKSMGKFGTEDRPKLQSVEQIRPVRVIYRAKPVARRVLEALEPHPVHGRLAEAVGGSGADLDRSVLGGGGGRDAQGERTRGEGGGWLDTNWCCLARYSQRWT